MAETEYGYTISTAFPSGSVNPTKLRLEIIDSDIVTPLSYVSTDEDSDNCAIWFDNTLSGGDVTILDGIVASHDGQAFANRYRVQQVSETTSADTTSLTDVLVPGMTLTPGPGSYLVNFTSSTRNSANNQTNFFSLYKGETQIASSKRKMKRGSAQGDVVVEISIRAYIENIGMNETIQIRWSVDGGTGTVFERSLVAELIAAEQA